MVVTTGSKQATMPDNSGVSDVLRSCLPDGFVGGSGEIQVARLVASPEITATAADFLATKIDDSKAELARLMGGGRAAENEGSVRLLRSAKELRSRVGTIRDRLGAIHASAGPALERPAAELTRAANSYVRLRDQEQVLAERASVMSALSAVAEQMHDLEACASSGDLAAAALCSTRIHDMLREPPLAALVEARVHLLENVESWVNRKRGELVLSASSLARSACTFISAPDEDLGLTINSRVPMKMPHDTIIRVAEVWACLRTIGGVALDRVVKAVASDLYDKFLARIFEPVRKAQQTQAAGDGDGADFWKLDVVCDSGSTVTARIRPSQTAVDALGFLHPLQELVQEVFTTLCGSDTYICGIFGANLWPRLGPQLVLHRSFATIDSSDIETFELALHQAGFVAELPSCLSTHTKGVQQRNVETICIDILCQGRDILLDCEARSSSCSAKGFLPAQRRQSNTDGSRAIFEFPRCQTSVRVNSLVSLLQESLLDVQSRFINDDFAFSAVADTIHQALDLFGSVAAPALNSERGPGPVAMLHNDCMLIAHRLLSLGFEQRPRVLNRSFVSRVPEFRTLAAQILNTYTGRIQREMAMHYSDADSFCLIWEPHRAKAATNAMGKVAYELERLGAVWHPILPRSSFVLALGSLVDEAAGWVVESVLKLADEDLLCYESSALGSLYSCLAPLQNVPAIFLPVTEADDTAENFCLAAGGAGWRRFRALHRLLKPEFKDVGAMWRAGELAPLHSSECITLLRALADEERVQAVLAEVQEAGNLGFAEPAESNATKS